VPGYELSQEDVHALKDLLARRDWWIAFYQRMELEKGRESEELHGYIHELEKGARVPLTGYVLQEGTPDGLYVDLWASSSMKVRIKPLSPVSELMLRGFRPDGSPGGMVRILVNGEQRGSGQASAGFCEATAILPSVETKPFEVEVLCDAPAAKAASDDRDLAFVMIELQARHPRCA
jgi:hypothetical protein